jgi:hypothetical protein
MKYIALALILSGCTTMSESYRITESDGSEIRYKSRVMSLGNGPAEFISAGDGTTAFATEGKGISDNGTEALGKIAEGIVKGAKGDPL